MSKPESNVKQNEAARHSTSEDLWKDMSDSDSDASSSGSESESQDGSGSESGSDRGSSKAAVEPQVPPRMRLFVKHIRDHGKKLLAEAMQGVELPTSQQNVAHGGLNAPGSPQSMPTLNGSQDQTWAQQLAKLSEKVDQLLMQQNLDPNQGFNVEPNQNQQNKNNNQNQQNQQPNRPSLSPSGTFQDDSVEVQQDRFQSQENERGRRKSQIGQQQQTHNGRTNFSETTQPSPMSELDNEDIPLQQYYQQHQARKTSALGPMNSALEQQIAKQQNTIEQLLKQLQATTAKVDQLSRERELELEILDEDSLGDIGARSLTTTLRRFSQQQTSQQASRKNSQGLGQTGDMESISGGKDIDTLSVGTLS